MHFLGWINSPGIKLAGKLEPVDIMTLPRHLGTQDLPHAGHRALASSLQSGPATPPLVSALNGPCLRLAVLWARPAWQPRQALSFHPCSRLPSLLKTPWSLLEGGLELSGSAICQLCDVTGEH